MDIYEEEVYIFFTVTIIINNLENFVNSQKKVCIIRKQCLNITILGFIKMKTYQ